MSRKNVHAGFEDRWRWVDVGLAGGELDVAGAIQVLGDEGLIRKANGLGLADARGALWVLEPARDQLVPGPRILLDHGTLYGGPRLYRPLRDLLLWDTGAFSGSVPANDADAR